MESQLVRELWVTWKSDLLSPQRTVREEGMSALGQAYALLPEDDRAFVELQMRDVIARWEREQFERPVRHWVAACKLLAAGMPIPLRVLIALVASEPRLVEKELVPSFCVSAAVLDCLLYAEEYPVELLAIEDRRRTKPEVLEDIATLLIAAATNVGPVHAARGI